MNINRQAAWKSAVCFFYRRGIVKWWMANKAKNAAKSFWRRNRTSLEDQLATLSFESEEASQVFESVMQLAPKYRIVVHLFYYEDYSVREIAEILKISEANVKTRLSRARAMLRDTLKEVWSDDE